MFYYIEIKAQLHNSSFTLNKTLIKYFLLSKKQLEDNEGNSHVVVKPMNGFAHTRQANSVEEITSADTLSFDSPDSCSQDVNEKLQSRSVSAVTAVKGTV